MTPFYIYLYVMIIIAICVFVALQFVTAGYGFASSPKWGKSINNKLAWFMMEFPIFASMIIIWLLAPESNKYDVVRVLFLVFFEIHYLQRVFIFPFLIKGNGTMPLAIMFMGMSFNVLNSAMQGYWIFFESPAEMYNMAWLTTPQFIIGTVLFFTGMYINIHSDYIIRHLRKSADDHNHYLPHGGMFHYVTSANYFGELVEWLGFAILTWSLSGFVFFIWTFANLVPRANALYKKYHSEFGDEMQNQNLKRVIPFIY